MRPDEFAGGRVEAIEISLAAERVDASVGKGRRPARAGAGKSFEESHRVGVDPDFFAAGGVVTGHDLFRIALLLRHHMPVDDDQTRPGRPEPLPPELLWSVGIPIEIELRAAQHGVAVRTAETGDIARLKRPGSHLDSSSATSGRCRRVAGKKQRFGRRLPPPTIFAVLRTVDAVPAQERKRAEHEQDRQAHRRAADRGGTISREKQDDGPGGHHGASAPRKIVQPLIVGSATVSTMIVPTAHDQ